MKTSMLILGDVIAIALLTVIGFVTHDETDLSFLPRMAALFFPLCIAWFTLAAALGLFNEATTSNIKGLWRPALAAFFAAPLAAALRGFLLSAPIIPVFAAVLAVVAALGMVFWRALYVFWRRRAR